MNKLEQEAKEWYEHPIFKNYWANKLGVIKTTNYRKRGKEKLIKQTKNKCIEFFPYLFY